MHVLIYSRYYTAKQYNIYAYINDGCSSLHLAADDVMSKLAFIYFPKLNSWGSNPRPSEYLPLAIQHTSYIIVVAVLCEAPAKFQLIHSLSQWLDCIGGWS